MQPAGARREREHRVPRLAPGWERCGLTLSPAEGFLLSRIDGSTPWALLREIGGLAPGEADRCLERWMKQGLSRSWAQKARPRQLPGRRRSLAEATPAGSDLEAQVDAGLEIPVEAQRADPRIRGRVSSGRTTSCSAWPPAPTPRPSSAPTSSSRRNTTPTATSGARSARYAEKLDRIFKKIVEAYELLSDPTTRAELERSISSRAPEPPAPAPAPAAAASAAAKRRDRAGSAKRPRRRRRPGRRSARAAAPASSASPTRSSPSGADARASSTRPRWWRLKKQRWVDAASSARLAIAFDPWNDEYKKRFARGQSHVTTRSASRS